MRKLLLCLLFVFLLTLPVIYPYVISGYPKTHDGAWAVIRLAEMHRELRDGQIPPVWSGYLNHGYGYPLFLFTYPLPYYVGELIHVSGVSVIYSIKILFILSTIVSGVAMFFLGSKIFGKWGGLIASVAYIYAPYRLVNLYVRGSLGEVFAWMFYPLLFIVSLAMRKPTKLVFIANTFLISLLILSHNASALLFLPFYILWNLFLIVNEKHNRKRHFTYFILSLTLGFICAAYFWIPALFEKKYIVISQISLTDKQNHFLSIPLLLGIGIHEITATKLHLGIIHIFLLIGAFFSSLFLIKDQTMKKKIIFLLSSFLLSIFFLFKISYPLWQIPVVKEIDFPWRMLGVSIFLLSLTLGVFGKLPKIKYIVVFLLLIIVFLNLQYIYVGERSYETSQYFETNDGTTTSNDELMPIWVSQKPKNRQNDFIFTDSLSSLISQINQKSHVINFHLKTDEPTKVTLNALYFPGWKLFINENEVPIQITKETGLISFYVSTGDYQIKLLYKSTTTQIIANIISILGFCSIVLLLWFQKRFPTL